MGSQTQNFENKNICRACMLNIESVSISLIKNTDLIDKYGACTSIQINFADGLPLNICGKCYEKLNEFYDFRKMCMVSQQKMLISLSNPNNLDNNENTQDSFSNSLKAEPIFKECKIEIEEFNVEAIQEQSLDDPIKENVDDERSFEEELQQTDKPAKEKIKKSNSDKKKLTKDGESTKNQNKQFFSCHLCNKKFVVHEKYVGHLRQHEGFKGFKCDMCDTELTSYKGLKRHKKDSHYESERVTCTVSGCGKTYKTRDVLRNHIREVHKGMKPASIVCELCGKVLLDSASLKRHKNVHAGIKPFPCNLCPKAFPTKSKLNIHILKHKGIKNYECAICGLKKTTGHELKVHMRVHTKERAYKCDYCDGIYTNPGNLKRHKALVHLKVKKFQCTYCDLSFGKAETLKHHVMRHTGEKPHECSICEKRFIQSVALQKHMKTHN